MITKKSNSIRLKISGGIADIQEFFKAVESFADFKNFEITLVKTKQRFNTPLWDMNCELTKIEDRTS